MYSSKASSHSSLLTSSSSCREITSNLSPLAMAFHSSSMMSWPIAPLKMQVKVSLALASSIVCRSKAFITFSDKESSFWNVVLFHKTISQWFF